VVESVSVRLKEGCGWSECCVTQLGLWGFVSSHEIKLINVVFQLMSKVVWFKNEPFACAQLIVRVLSGAQQINFAWERLDKFGCQVLMHINGGISILVDCRGVAKARWVVESRPHHHMRGSGDPQTRGNRGNRWLYSCRWKKDSGNIYLDIGCDY
jgi:hypothetical protein